MHGWTRAGLVDHRRIGRASTLPACPSSQTRRRSSRTSARGALAGRGARRGARADRARRPRGQRVPPRRRRPRPRGRRAVRGALVRAASRRAARRRPRRDQGRAAHGADGRRCAARGRSIPTGRGTSTRPPSRRCARNGAVAVGKTTTPEFGWKGVTRRPARRRHAQPVGRPRTAGGSSGGSSAALAAGMVPLALGTDGGGSIRIPCGFCGLPGIKPTYGRVPAWPASPFGVLAHVGPMARTVRDVALLLDVLAEPDLRDWTALEPAATPLRDGLDDGVRGPAHRVQPRPGLRDRRPRGRRRSSRAPRRAWRTSARTSSEVDPGFPDPRGTFETLWFAGARASSPTSATRRRRRARPRPRAHRGRLGSADHGAASTCGRCRRATRSACA